MRPRQNGDTLSNQSILQAYWHLGREIVEFEQAGQEGAEMSGVELDDTFEFDAGHTPSKYYNCLIFASSVALTPKSVMQDSYI